MVPHRHPQCRWPESGDCDTAGIQNPSRALRRRAWHVYDDWLRDALPTGSNRVDCWTKEGAFHHARAVTATRTAVNNGRGTAMDVLHRRLFLPRRQRERSSRGFPNGVGQAVLVLRSDTKLSQQQLAAASGRP